MMAYELVRRLVLVRLVERLLATVDRSSPVWDVDQARVRRGISHPQ